MGKSEIGIYVGSKRDVSVMSTWKRNEDTGKMEIISVEPQIIELEAEEVGDEYAFLEGGIKYKPIGLSLEDHVKSTIEDSRLFREMLMKAHGLKEEDLTDPKEFKTSIEESKLQFQAKFNQLNKRKPKQDFSWDELEQLTNQNESDL